MSCASAAEYISDDRVGIENLSRTENVSVFFSTWRKKIENVLIFFRISFFSSTAPLFYSRLALFLFGSASSVFPLASFPFAFFFHSLLLSRSSSYFFPFFHVHDVIAMLALLLCRNRCHLRSQSFPPPPPTMIQCL